MMAKAMRGGAALAICAAMALGGAAETRAQTKVQAAGANRDWAVYADGEGADRMCWILSTPKRSAARRGGSNVRVNRGDIYLTVAHFPASGVRNEVSTVIGYPFREGSSVEVRIGSDSFSMFTQGEKAWLPDAAADSRMVDAMRRGAEATLTGISSRGTTTIDTYSLIGFTAALEEADRLCQ
jgi:hypothetical protein